MDNLYGNNDSIVFKKKKSYMAFHSPIVYSALRPFVQ